MPTPENYTTLFPYLFVDDAEAYIDFLSKGLGGEEMGRTKGDDGHIANSRVRFGNTTIMLSEARGRFPVSQVSLFLYVHDADAARHQALDAGATLEMEVADMDYGDRQGGVRDPRGIVWWISQRLVKGGYDDQV